MSDSERLWSRSFAATLFIAFCSNTVQQMSNGTLAIYIDSIGGYAGFSGLLAVVFAVASITFRVVSGKLFDMIGGKYIIMAGGVIYAVASLLYPKLSILWLALLLRFLQGIGFSSISTSANAAAAKIAPPSRIGEGMSYLGVMAALGSAVGPTLGVYIWRRKGSPAIFIALAAIALLITFAAIMSNFEKTIGQGASRSLPKEPHPHLNGLRITKLQLSASIVTMFIAIPQSFILTYIILYGDQKGCIAADYFFAISAGAMILSRVLFGKCYDRYGVRRTLIPSVLVGIGSMTLLCLLPNTVGFILGAVLYGISYGVATPVLTAESVRLAPKERKGGAVAVYYIGYDLGIGLGALLWGTLIDSLGYHAVFLISILFLCAAVYGSFKIGKYSVQ